MIAASRFQNADAISNAMFLEGLMNTKTSGFQTGSRDLECEWLQQHVTVKIGDTKSCLGLPTVNGHDREMFGAHLLDPFLKTTTGLLSRDVTRSTIAGTIPFAHVKLLF